MDSVTDLIIESLNCSVEINLSWECFQSVTLWLLTKQVIFKACTHPRERGTEGARGHLSRISRLCTILLNCKARKICIAKTEKEERTLNWSFQAEHCVLHCCTCATQRGVEWWVSGFYYDKISPKKFAHPAWELLTWPSDWWCEHEQNFCGVTKHEAIRYPERISQWM